MSEANIAVVRQGYEAHDRGDHAGVFALLHPAFEIFQTDQVPWGGSYRGREQARQFFQHLAEHIESRVSPEEFIAAGDRVAVTGHIRGHVRATGTPFDLRIVHIWTVRDGLAARFEAYIDTPGMRRALGQEPA